MIVASLPHRYTVEDLDRLPDNGGIELVNGQIVEKRMSYLFSITEMQIGYIFMRFTDKNHVAVIFPQSMGYQCFQSLEEDPERVRKPDVSVIRIERHRQLQTKNPGYMPIPPDLAVEVLSSNDVISKVDDKILEYLAAGFPLVWIVDPILRTVTVYSQNSDKPAIYGKNSLIDAPNALPGFSCKVADLFPLD